MNNLKNKYNIKELFKNNILIIIVLFIFIYSTGHICIYIFGHDRALYVKTELDANLDLSYRVWYNNGKKMVQKPVHLSFIEFMQLEKNSGRMKFKQLGTQITHRSSFIYSIIYDVIFIISSTFFISSNRNKNKKMKSKLKEEQLILNE